MLFSYRNLFFRTACLGYVIDSIFLFFNDTCNERGLDLSYYWMLLLEMVRGHMDVWLFLF